MDTLGITILSIFHTFLPPKKGEQFVHCREVVPLFRMSIIGGSTVYIPLTRVYLSIRGGVKFSELTAEQALLFQQQILATLLEVERTFDLLAERDSRNVLIVCDRGSMDPFACE